MTIIKSLVLSVLTIVMAMSCGMTFAQNSNPSNLTSSPYTRYGFGKLGNVGNASTRALGDAGIALRTNQYTNLYNPASLTAIDTLTMLFDVALDAEWFTLSENGATESDWNAGFSYLSFHFPLWNRFSGAIAYNPYSMIGYEYGTDDENHIDHALINNDTVSQTNTFTGNGGLQHFQLSLAWNPIKTRTFQWNLGATAGYICGTVDHTNDMSITIKSGSSNSTNASRNYSCMGWDLLLGTQLTRQLTPGRSLTLGATFSPRTHIGCDANETTISGTDTIGSTNHISLSAPMKFGAGLSYQVDRKLTVTGEYAFENWAKVSGIAADMTKSNDIYQNVSRISAGIEYRPKTYAQDYLQICTYRAGFSMKNSYIKSFGNQQEMTASCGVGLPVGKRSLFNLSVAYSHLTKGEGAALSENYLHLTLGITFNEMMFYRSRLR